MNPWVGWALALAAVVGGWLSYSWQGLVLAVTVIVFWLLLQFSRSLRALQRAGQRPLGTVANAVMLHARLQAGLRLPQVLALAGSLGRKVGGSDADGTEAWAWADEAGDEVRVELTKGRVSAWKLTRAADAPRTTPPAAAGEPGAGT
ncbi:MAG: hypothetical protein KIS83_00900 [Rubrivivax sp.]|nr:hypothetical protein [Rubrivivax sp.]